LKFGKSENQSFSAAIKHKPKIKRNLSRNSGFR